MDKERVVWEAIVASAPETLGEKVFCQVTEVASPHRARTFFASGRLGQAVAKGVGVGAHLALSGTWQEDGTFAAREILIQE